MEDPKALIVSDSPAAWEIVYDYVAVGQVAPEFLDAAEAGWMALHYDKAPQKDSRVVLTSYVHLYVYLLLAYLQEK